MKSELQIAWDKEKNKHIGDYGDSSEYDLWCAFKCGWMACNRKRLDNKTIDKFFEDFEIHFRVGVSPMIKLEEYHDFKDK